MSRWRLGVLVAVAVLVAAACSGGGSADTAEPDAAPAEAAAEPSVGCGAAAEEAGAGQERVTITSGGTERWFLRRVPAAHDGTEPLPVVVDLHGYSVGAEAHAGFTRLGDLGDEEGFVTVTPQASGPVPLWDFSVTSPDVEFLAGVLDEVGVAQCIDESRVYVTGMSNGAMMTSAVACALADRIAAAAPVAGVWPVAGCDPAGAVPAVVFHGTADSFLSYEGGLGPSVANLTLPDGSGQRIGDVEVPDEIARGPSVPEIVGAWAVRNGCAPEPEEESLAADVTLVSFSCPEGAEVVHYRIEGGGHTWPDSESLRGAESAVGPTTASISANEVMWAFFGEHTRR